jgi:hypothetical protein
VKVLLDNCVRRDMRGAFEQHECRHALDLGWAELTNGQLLQRASAEFDVLITVDKNMRFQTSLTGLDLTVVVLDVRSNLAEELFSGCAKAAAVIETLPKGEFFVISTD